MHCKAKPIINPKPNPTKLDARDLILLWNLTKTLDIDLCTEKKTISIGIYDLQSFQKDRIL